MRLPTSSNRIAFVSYIFSVSVALIAAPLAGETAPQRPAAPAANQAVPESPNELFVNVGKSVVVDSSLPIQRVSVGFGDVAEATAVSPTEVLVNGKTPGETSLIVWQEGGSKLFFDVTVQPSRFQADSRLNILRRQISTELPGQKVQVSIENDLIFLRGTAKDLTSANRAVEIAATMGKPVNLLYVAVPPPEAQILLKVRFASVDRNRSRQLGLNIFSLGATNTVGSVSTQQFSPPSISSSSISRPETSVTASLTNALNLFFFRPDLNLGATIQALEVQGVLQTLAEPNVLAENGQQASFLAGGEFPYPVVQGAGVGGSNAVTIQFREFGVRLNFIPTITPRGTIRLQVAPEVSTLDFTNGLLVQGFSVPGISVRNVNTEVELGEGQSFAIGGLLNNSETQTFEKIPFIGDIPILGKLFQSKSTSKSNTELIVIVTPEIVRPIPAGQPLPQPKFPLPFLPPNTGTPMQTPGQQTTGPVPVTPPAPAIPVETLLKSMQPEKPLVVRSTGGGGYMGGGQSSLQTAPAPASAPPAAGSTPP